MWTHILLVKINIKQKKSSRIKFFCLPGVPKIGITQRKRKSRWTVPKNCLDNFIPYGILIRISKHFCVLAIIFLQRCPLRCKVEVKCSVAELSARFFPFRAISLRASRCDAQSLNGNFFPLFKHEE